MAFNVLNQTRRKNNKYNKKVAFGFISAVLSLLKQSHAVVDVFFLSDCFVLSLLHFLAKLSMNSLF